MTIENEEKVIGQLLEAVKNGTSLKDIMGLPDDAMNGIYSYAYDFYQQGRLNEAEKFFEFLCMYDLHNADYFLGLGAVYQLKKMYEKACDFYGLAFALSTNEYRSVFYTGQCQMLLGNFVRAKQCFELVIEKSKDESIVQKANVYLPSIDAALSESTNRDPAERE